MGSILNKLFVVYGKNNDKISDFEKIALDYDD